MELPVSTQAGELLAAWILGLLLGVSYDLLRPLRRGRITTALTDLLFCLLTTLSLLAFLLYAGRGRLRIFALFGMLAGASIWFLTGSRPLRRLGAVLGRLLGLPLRLLRAIPRKNSKKIEKIVRK